MTNLCHIFTKHRAVPLVCSLCSQKDFTLNVFLLYYNFCNTDEFIFSTIVQAVHITDSTLDVQLVGQGQAFHLISDTW